MFSCILRKELIILVHIAPLLVSGFNFRYCTFPIDHSKNGTNGEQQSATRGKLLMFNSFLLRNLRFHFFQFV